VALCSANINTLQYVILIGNKYISINEQREESDMQKSKHRIHEESINSLLNTSLNNFFYPKSAEVSDPRLILKRFFLCGFQTINMQAFPTYQCVLRITPILTILT
jgi:hypothetical protein